MLKVNVNYTLKRKKEKKNPLPQTITEKPHVTSRFRSKLGETELLRRYCNVFRVKRAACGRAQKHRVTEQSFGNVPPEITLMQ